MSSLTTQRLRELTEVYFFKAQYQAQTWWKWYLEQSLLRKIVIGGLTIFMFAFPILLLFNYETYLQFFVKLAKWIRERKYGGLLIFFLLILVSFPPLAGLAALCNLTGMAYGMSIYGWLIVTVGVAVGSSLSFVVFKHLFAKKSQELLKTSKLFTAFAGVVAQGKDKFFVLCLLQLCPRPYSITNAAFASIPSLTLWDFFLSGLVASPKYFLSIYVGYKMEHIGENKDFKTRLVDLFTILATATVSGFTSYLIYKRTVKKLQELNGEFGDEDDASASLLESMESEDEEIV